MVKVEVEYKVIEINPHIQMGYLEKLLIPMGNDGWMVICSIHNMLILCRQTMNMVWDDGSISSEEADEIAGYHNGI